MSASVMELAEKTMLKNARIKGTKKEHHMKLYKTPKETSQAMLQAAANKAKYSIVRLMVLGWMSGMIIGYFTQGSLAVASMVEDVAGIYSPQLSKFIFGYVLPMALVLISLMGTELLTGNFMYFTVANLAGTVSIPRTAYILAVITVSNFAGAVTWAGFMAYFTDLFAHDPFHAYLLTVVHTKTSLPFGIAFLRGFGGNFSVCLSIYAGMCAEDMSGKIIATIVTLNIMVFSAFEHVVLNFFLLTLGLMYGAPDLNFCQVIYKNWIPVWLGNMCGGMIIGIFLYSMFVHGTTVVPNELIPPPSGVSIPVHDVHWSLPWIIYKIFPSLKNRRD